MTKKEKKIAIFATNASQYHVPIYRALARSQSLDLTVLYSTDLGIKGFYDKQSNAFVEWDIDLSEGYKYKIFKNLASRNNRGFFRAVNFGVIPWIFKNRHDLILIQGYNTFTSWLVFFTALINGTNLAWRGESIIADDNKRSLFSNIKNFILRQYFKHFDYVFYSCAGNKSYLEQFIDESEKLKLFPCAVDNSFFSIIKDKYNKDRSEIRESYSINDQDIIILFAARFIKRKRPYDLIEAMKDINDKRIVLMFCGDGPEKELMQKKAGELSIRTIFTGLLGQEQLGVHYLISDIYTILSDYDNSPKTLNEAVNFGLPILATNMLGNAYDLVEEGKNGFIVNAKDISAIRERIKFLIENIEKMRTSSTETSEKILNEWSIEKDVDAVLSILK